MTARIRSLCLLLALVLIGPRVWPALRDAGHRALQHSARHEIKRDAQQLGKSITNVLRDELRHQIENRADTKRRPQNDGCERRPNDDRTATADCSDTADDVLSAAMRARRTPRNVLSNFSQALSHTSKRRR